MSGHSGSGAALVLVLFILLVIILLASWIQPGCDVIQGGPFVG
ncbi:YjcZ family sporulation protein [Chengkuizengella sediminis]|nr:YjcZ family sporulation protein [Chengkuizengella sediminis]NDI33607.1 YjcZ family sporulation protein [Chengkuizengella sediminis]